MYCLFYVIYYVCTVLRYHSQLCFVNTLHDWTFYILLFRLVTKLYNTQDYCFQLSLICILIESKLYEILGDSEEIVRPQPSSLGLPTSYLRLEKLSGGKEKEA